MLENISTLELVWFLILTVYACAVTIATKYTYHYMRSKGIEENVAVYYNRKIIHMMAGGLVVLAVPFLFSTPWLPLFAGVVLTIFTYIPHKRGKILYWFQTEDNLNDVNFCFMWALTVFVLWMALGTPWLAIIPPAFMAFGDGVTGIVRNALFKRRTKHYAGNVFMLVVCIMLGYYLAMRATPSIPIWGVIAAGVATFVERYEFGPIDDNILITVSSALVLAIGYYLGPLL